ncbi:MAG: phosphate acyltransferase PlsX [Desulfovibrio sp.]|nr:MAG: phosphate acyltransferase PlsX [Desulfovibrio sp.]
MTKQTPTVAVDAMGGDVGCSVTVRGAMEAAKQGDIHLILVGDEAKIRPEMNGYGLPEEAVSVVHTTEVVGMDEKPSEVLRKKRDSSIHIACQLVKEGKAQGVVSAGNSGATVACGMFILGRIAGVERPALASIMYVQDTPTVLIDVGANVDCKPYHLFQFGLMADVLARDVLNIPTPKVGLLSIGEEEGKGNIQVKEAFELFKMSSLNFVGNVEGRDIFSSEADVVVCDGFVGNVALKLSEGLGASLAKVFLKELNTGDLSAKLGSVLIQGAIKRFNRIVDYAEYGGAPLLGLKGITIVCHGASNTKAVTKAVEMAGTFIRKKANEHLTEDLTANEELTRFARAAVKQ